MTKCKFQEGCSIYRAVKYLEDCGIESVQKTGKLLIAHEAPRNCGFGAEIAARVSEEAFESLDGPIHRICGFDSAVPYSKSLENEVLPQLEDLEVAIRRLVRY